MTLLIPRAIHQRRLLRTIIDPRTLDIGDRRDPPSIIVLIGRAKHRRVAQLTGLLNRVDPPHRITLPLTLIAPVIHGLTAGVADDPALGVGALAPGHALHHQQIILIGDPDRGVTARLTQVDRIVRPRDIRVARQPGDRVHARRIHRATQRPVGIILGDRGPRPVTLIGGRGPVGRARGGAPRQPAGVVIGQRQRAIGAAGRLDTHTIAIVVIAHLGTQRPRHPVTVVIGRVVDDLLQVVSGVVDILAPAIGEIALQLRHLLWSPVRRIIECPLQFIFHLLRRYGVCQCLVQNTPRSAEPTEQVPVSREQRQRLFAVPHGLVGIEGAEAVERDSEGVQLSNRLDESTPIHNYIGGVIGH